MSSPADALQEEDEHAFLESLQTSLAEQLEAGTKQVSIDLTGVLQMPEAFMQPLRTAVDVVGGLGATLRYRCHNSLAPLLEAAGLPYEVVSAPEVEQLPLVESEVSEFTLDDEWLVAHEPNDAVLIADFEFWFEDLLSSREAIQVDLRPRRFVSPRFARAIVECARRARDEGKAMTIRVTSAQELALSQIDDALDLIQIDRAPLVRRPTEVMRSVDRATQAVNEAFRQVVAGADQRHGRERRLDVRLSIRNAYVIYQTAPDTERRRTRLEDISIGGLGFLSSTPIEAEQMMRLHLQLPAFLSPERVIGKVASCHLCELDDGSQAFRIGIRYAAPLSERLEARLRLLQATGGDRAP